MANIASAKKRARKSAKRTEVRTMYKSRVRNMVVKVEKAIAAGEAEAAANFLRECQSLYARAAQRNYFKKGTFSRKISRLSQGLNKVQSS